MQRTYPLADNATCMSDSGVLLPPSFLADIQLVLPEMTDPNAQSKFYISSIVRTTYAFRIVLSYQATATRSIECAITGDIPASLTNTADIEARTVQLSPTAADNEEFPQLADLSGKIIIGTCMDMRDKGAMTFQYAATNIIGVRVYFYRGTLDSVTFSGDNGSFTLNRNFTLQAGDGVDFSLDESGDEPVVTIHRRSTQDEDFQNQFMTVDDVIAKIERSLGNPVRMINGVIPDSNGNINIEPGDCLDVEVNENTLNISNPCGSPCCGEALSSDLRSQLDFLQEAQARLLECYTALGNNISTLQARLVSLMNAD